MRTCLWTMAAASAALISASSQAIAEFPERPIRALVHVDAGGGTDSIARIIQRTLQSENLLPQPLVVVNMPGGGGTIASRTVKEAEPDGYTIMIHHPALFTAAVVGQAEYGLEAFEPIAQTGSQCTVIAVAEDSPFQTLDDLVRQAAESPRSINAAVNIGAVSHFAAAAFADAADIELNMANIGGGGPSFAALLGGHVDMAVFALAGFSQFQQSGARGLAMLDDERHPDLPDLPTARELGYDSRMCVDHWWFAPAGTPQDRVDILADAIEQAMALPEIQDWFNDRMNLPVFRRGEALREALEAEYALLRRIGDDAGLTGQARGN